MHITVLVPEIHHRPTGGNIYNRRVAQEMRDRASVEVISWPEETPPPPLPLPAGSSLLVDSLLVHRLDALASLRSAHPNASFVLLAHYLHCVDPNERDAPAASTERAAFRLFDGVVATSRYVKRALSNEGIRTPSLFVVPPGLDPTYRAPAPKRPASGSPQMLTVASLLPGKGLPLLIDLLETLTDVNWTWTLVGDDSLDPDFAASIRKRVEASSVSTRTHVTGPLPPSEMQTQYDRAHLFVLPSHFETSSMAMREAMARKCPVVGFDVGGLSENVGSAPAARLVSPNQPAHMASALRDLLTDKRTRIRMGQAARAQSQSFPSWRDVGTQLHSVLRGLRLPR